MTFLNLLWPSLSKKARGTGDRHRERFPYRVDPYITSHYGRQHGGKADVEEGWFFLEQSPDPRQEEEISPFSVSEFPSSALIREESQGVI